MSDLASDPIRGGARAYLVWGVGVAAYACAVLQRTSFGVAGLEAAQRFGLPAGVVSTFVVVQLLTYALLQVPAGVLIDRFGSRTMLTAGLVIMALGQLSLATASALATGVVARILVGAGDAMMFASAIRLVPSWFPARTVPVYTQLTGMLGQSGQIASAVPFAFALHTYGWQAAFLVAAASCGVFAIAVPLLVRDRPEPGGRPPRGSGDDDSTGLLAHVALAWRSPSTRLGLWMHYATSFPSMVFAMMWGYPYLTRGEGLPGAAASALITLFVLAGLPFAPTVGTLTRRHPLRRSNLALAVVAANLVPWVVVLAWPGPAPLWLLVVLMVGMALGGPGSGIGFDLARTGNPPHRLGTANGIVIMGGFVGALLAILLIGITFDAMRSAGADDLRAFRVAMAIQVPMLLVGIGGVARSRRTARGHLHAVEGVEVRPLREVLRERRARADRTHGPGGGEPPG